MSQDPLSRAIEAADGQSALARALGITYQAIDSWKKRGVPGPRVLDVEAATRGRVSRHELRPDIFGPPASPAPEGEVEVASAIGQSASRVTPAARATGAAA